MVKEEELSKVAAGFKYLVNNKHDGKRRVRSPENIVKMAMELVGKEWPYRLTQENSEHFAIELRYGEPICKQNRLGPEPIPGDLIEISNYRFKHWAVYVGDGFVVKLVNIDTMIPTVKSTLAASVQDTQPMVKKLLLSEVVRESVYWVNNKHDGKRRVRSPQNIAQIASGLVGQEWPYRFSEKNCEHFVTELRYGEPISEERILSPEPTLGDLIEFFRGGKFNNHSLEYDHWAVYVGNNCVVHLTNPDFRKSDPKTVNTLPDIVPKGVVKKELLSDVAAGCDFRVNNKYDRKFSAQPPVEIARRALILVGQEWHHSTFNLNCETFAMRLRYGHSYCAQEEDPFEVLVHSVGV
ncbi:uncharacterized protein LOC130039922 isoform X2 [Sorex fumeus]|nr:uncharacterized protein LOC130039922 isoform X2 [Sorex fumeus]